MKSKVKALLARLGLLESVRFLYSFVKGATLSILVREFRLRVNGSQDRLPLPPAQMMYKVISTRWAATFLDSGETIVNAMEDALRSSGKSLGDFHSILDFGCGCGRLLRHLPKRTKATLLGCDYNPQLIGWCERNLPIAKFAVNSLEPPLPYPDRSFDFIYARSVFTHLSERGQAEWLEEINRVLKPGGMIYLTMHGEQFFDQLSIEERKAVHRGGMVIHLASEEGRNLCTSFELPEYVRAHLPRELTILNYVPGSPREHLKQDGYVLAREIG